MSERNKINIMLRLNGCFGYFDGVYRVQCCDYAESL
jgi:hypothetical protein